MSLVPPAARRPRSPAPLGEAVAAAAALAAVIFVYCWMAASSSDDFGFRGPRADYYNRLSHGFLAGHLYMDVAPLAQPAPEAADLGLGNMPYLLDASLYRGRYYLYFGPVPVAVLFLPYRLLTGWDLSDHVAAPLLASLGFLAWTALLWRLRRRCFPAAPPWLFPLLVLLLGLGNGCPIMLRRPMFYEVAIASAHLFLGLAGLGVDWALARPERRGRALAGLAAAGLAFGLAVGSRANYAPGSLALLVPCWLSCRQRGAAGRRAATWWPEAAAVLAPLALCAGLLALYNYARFGHLLEFGVKYQLTYKPVFSPRFIPYNLRLYYGSLPEWSWYFPYVYPVDEGLRPAGYVGFEHLHGQAWTWLLAPFLAAGAWLASAPAADGAGRALAGVAAFVGLAGLQNAFVLLSLAGRANRYVVDFQPALLFLAALAALAFFTSGAFSRRMRGAGAAVLVTGVALLGAHNVAAGIQLYNILQETSPALYRRLAQAANLPAGWMERRWADRGGAVELSLTFPPGRPGHVEPLVVTGVREYDDLVAVEYGAGDSLRFVFAHFGYPRLAGELLPVDRGRPHTLTIDLGALYPPREHPWFNAWPRGVATLLKRRVAVTLDGAPGLRAASASHDASPGRVAIGVDPLGTPGVDARFSGQITSVRRLGWDAGARQLAWADYGALDLHLELPNPPPVGAQQPLVVTGAPGAADGLYIRYDDPTHVSFGLDRLGTGGSAGAPVAADYRVPHEVEVWMGSLFPPADSAALRGLPAYAVTQVTSQARVLLDGQEVFRSPGPFHEVDPRLVDVGGNFGGLSSISGTFTGVVRDVRRLPLPTAEASPSGPVRFDVGWPAGRAGHNEPLLSTGITGRGDVLFVNYLDDHRARLGWDHWGVGVVYSAPFPLDAGPPHEVEISLGSLYPDNPLQKYIPFVRARLAGLRRQYRVRLDGEVVFAGDGDFYVASVDQTGIGTNLLGASSCEPAFTGSISRVTRPWSAEAAPLPDAVALDVRFPAGRAGLVEPLLVTGRTGAADAVLVTYVDAGHVQFSWDHWGAGGPRSEVLPVDYQAVHHLELAVGSLRPARPAVPDGPPATELRVRLDGDTGFRAQGTFYPAGPGDPVIGANRLGLTSAQPAFTGSVEFYRGPNPAPR